MKQQASQRRGMSREEQISGAFKTLQHACAPPPSYPTSESQNVHFYFPNWNTFFRSFPSQNTAEQCLIDFSTRCRSVRAVDVCFGSAQVGCVTEFMVHQQRARMSARKLYDGAEVVRIKFMQIQHSILPPSLLWCACNGNNFARKS